MKTIFDVLARAQGRLRNSDAAAAWLAGVGLTYESAARIGLGLLSECAEGLDFIYPQRGDDGIAYVSKLRIGADGVAMPMDGPASVPVWSEPPFDGADVVMTVDVISMWLLSQTFDGAGVAKPLMVTSSVSGSLPAAWTEDTFWERFGSLTLMLDADPAWDQVQSAMATIASLDVGAAKPLRSKLWRETLASGADCKLELFAALEDPPSLADLLPRPRVGDNCARSAAEPTSVHDLDPLGRMVRIVAVEEQFSGDGAAMRGTRLGLAAVRSDRRLLDLVTLPWPSGTPASERVCALSDGSRLDRLPSPAACSKWSIADAEAFVARRSQPESTAELAADLVAEVAGDLGLCEADARTVAAMILLTHVYPAFPRLPVLVIVSADHVLRMRVAEVMLRLCHAARAVGRARIRSLARLADDTGGTFILNDPGPMITPNGLTEMGRFMASSVIPGLSTEHDYDSRGGFRTLRTFGPRIVCSARWMSGSWPDAAVVQIDASLIRPDARRHGRDLAQRLCCWSMELVSDIRDLGAGLKSGVAALDLLLRLTGWEPIGHPTAQPTERDLDGLLRLAVDGCRADVGARVSLTQITLEAARLGGVGEAFTPERIGRWLQASGMLAPDVAVDRRRLHGEITRIYDLKPAAGDASATPFAFCAEACGACRYADPCARIMPRLKAAKTARR